MKEPTNETLKFIDTDILRTALHNIDYNVKRHGSAEALAILETAINLFLAVNNLTEPEDR